MRPNERKYILDAEGNPLTDPYGHLEYCIGSDDDFVCLDFARLPDGRVVLHSVVNSETGGFIQDFDYRVVSASQARGMAEAMLDSAWTWCYDNEVVVSDQSAQASKDFIRDLKRCLEDDDD